MNRAQIREVGKGLVDGDFADDKWDGWINIGINTMSNAIESGFKRSVSLVAVDGAVALPTYITSIIEVFCMIGGVLTKLPYDKSSDARSDTSTKAYYFEDNKIKLSWSETTVSLEVHAECSATPLTNDVASPDFIIPEFQDIPGIYAAMLSQIYDDEQDKYKALSKIFDARLSMFATKVKRYTRGGRANYGFTNGVIPNGR